MNNETVLRDPHWPVLNLTRRKETSAMQQKAPAAVGNTPFLIPSFSIHTDSSAEDLSLISGLNPAYLASLYTKKTQNPNPQSMLLRFAHYRDLE